MLLVAAAALPAAGVYAYLELWPQELSRRLEAQLIDCREEEIPAIVSRLESCGMAGVPARVRLLGSPRLAAAEAARISLESTLQSLAEGDGPIDDAELAVIAEELDRLTKAGDAGTPATVTNFVWTILETTGRLRLDDRLPLRTDDRLVVVCNELLDRPMPTVARPVAPIAPTIAAEPAVTAPPEVATTISSSAASIAPEPLPPAPQMVTTTATGPVSVAVPIPIPRMQSAANSAARVNPIRGTIADSQVAPASVNPQAAVPQSMPRTADSPATSVTLAARTAWSLFSELAAEGTAEARAAESELRRRGFRDDEIQLGRHLTSPDAAERLHYTQRLPSLAGASLKPWLLHLSADPDAAVRHACLAMMATNQDTAIQARIRELAFTDGDEAIRQTASRALDAASQRR